MFNKLKQRVELLEEGELEDLKIIKGISDRVKILEGYDSHHTHRANVHDGLIGKVENDVDQLRDDLRLVMEYLGVHKEVLNETVLVDDDCKCDECYLDEVEEEFWEDVEKEKEPKYTAKEWAEKVNDWGAKFEDLKKTKK